MLLPDSQMLVLWFVANVCGAAFAIPSDKPAVQSNPDIEVLIDSIFGKGSTTNQVENSYSPPQHSLEELVDNIYDSLKKYKKTFHVVSNNLNDANNNTHINVNERINNTEVTCKDNAHLFKSMQTILDDIFYSIKDYKEYELVTPPIHKSPETTNNPNSQSPTNCTCVVYYLCNDKTAPGDTVTDG